MLKDASEVPHRMATHEDEVRLLSIAYPEFTKKLKEAVTVKSGNKIYMVLEGVAYDILKIARNKKP
jgi:hypothetical protein